MRFLRTVALGALAMPVFVLGLFVIFVMLPALIGLPMFLLSPVRCGDCDGVLAEAAMFGYITLIVVGNFYIFGIAGAYVLRSLVAKHRAAAPVERADRIDQKDLPC